MSELTSDTIMNILHDIRQDAALIQQKIDMLTIPVTGVSPNYEMLDNMHYIVRVMESRIRILRGYDR